MLKSAIDNPGLAAAAFSAAKPWLVRGGKYLLGKVVEHGVPYLKKKYKEWK